VVNLINEVPPEVLLVMTKLTSNFVDDPVDLAPAAAPRAQAESAS